MVETWKNVGGKIRQLRRANQLTIRQLAKGCDLSANAISLVERGEVAPSVATLCKIARALGVSASSLFHEVCTPDVVLSRAGRASPDALIERAIDSLGGARLPDGWSSSDTHSKRIKDSACELPGVSRHSVLCLCGRITFEVDDQSFCLEAGDQLSFNGEAFHRWHNTGDSTGVAVLILPAEVRAISNTGG